VGVLARTVIELANADRRRHERVKVRVNGRFMRSNRQEFDCSTIDLSPGGIALQSDVGVELGERIVAYLVHLGRLEGTVARTFPGGFAIRMKLPATKRAKLAEQLTWLASRALLGLPEGRRHDRIEPRNSRTTVTLTSGRAFLARLIDVSQSGAAVAVDVRPAIGERVTIGSTPAQVVRLFNDGIAVEFAQAMPDEAFGADVTL
jgi:PilZ domain